MTPHHTCASLNLWGGGPFFWSKEGSSIFCQGGGQIFLQGGGRRGNFLNEEDKKQRKRIKHCVFVAAIYLWAVLKENEKISRPKLSFREKNVEILKFFHSLGRRCLLKLSDFLYCMPSGRPQGGGLIKEKVTVSLMGSPPHPLHCIFVLPTIIFHTSGSSEIQI